MDEVGAGPGEDHALVARVAGGDRVALEMLYRRHANWLTARLQPRCGDADLADIAIQDTSLAVRKSARMYRGDGDVGAWLWGIAIRRLIDQLRRTRATPVDPAVIARHTDDVTRFDDEFFADGTHGDLGVAMRALPSELRAVLVATAIDGLSTKEAARLLGPNGCGKSTLLRCVATVMEPDSGTVTIDGLDPRTEPERIEARRHIGYSPQEAGFDARLRVFAAVDYIGVLKGLDETRRRRRSVFEALDRVRLADRMSERVGDLSGGMRRRLVMAQALLGSPTLLILDEPGAGLDPDERLRLREVPAERRRTTTVVLATHLTDEAAGADTVIVLGAGHVLFAGSPAQLAAHAAGRVWLQAGFPPPGVRASRQRADGGRRCLGNPPPAAELLQPTLEEGYLVVQELIAARA